MSVASTIAATPAFAHASDRGHVLLLPTGYYLAGGACAVAASFLGLALIQPGALDRIAAWRLPLGSLSNRLRRWTCWFSFVVFVLLLGAGIFGSRDPLTNPLPLVVWTLLWIGLTLLQGVFGNLWAWIGPWAGPVALVRRIVPIRERRYPPWLGCWPALVLFVAFTWFELIDVAPDDPLRLAAVAGIYWLVTLLAMLVFGHEAWSRHGEFLSVFFRMISRFGMVEAASSHRDGRTRFRLCAPGAKLWTERPLGMSGTLFLLVALAAVSFDGFAKTFFWLGANGINPLEYPGRTALQATNTVGLVCALFVLGAAFLLAVAIGKGLAGRTSPALPTIAGLLVWSIVPIALAYHFAHYLTSLMVNAQYAVIALSDPLGFGWTPLGIDHEQVEAGVVMGHEAAHVIWKLQAAAIIGGHVLAVMIAHGMAHRLFGDRRATTLTEAPLTVLMIVYTVFGLWLLSTPTAG